LVTLADGRERNRASIFAQGDIDHGRDGKTTFGAQTHGGFLSAQASNQTLRHFLKLTRTIEDAPMNFKGFNVNNVAKMSQKSSFFQNLS
jgi:hypothetical protein